MDKPLRILYLSAWYPFPFDNGSKLRVYHFMKALSEQHRVTSISFAYDTAQPDDGLPFCKQVYTVAQDPFDRPELSTSTRFLSLTPVVDKPIDAMRQLVNTVARATPFDVVIASTTVMATYALQLSCTRILEEHNLNTTIAHERFQAQTTARRRVQGWANWQKRRRYDRRLFNRFDGVTMVSERDGAATRRLAPSARVAVVTNGVDCEFNRPNQAPKQPATLIYSGALTYQANYDAVRYFLNAIYPRIKAKRPDVQLLITGSTRGVDIAGLNIDDSVTLTGYVEDIRPVVAQATVSVVPILTGGGTRLKILEAMALGTPIVATSKGAEGLDVQHNVHLMIADEPNTFAASVLTLLRDEQRRNAISDAARRLVVDHYDWQNIGRKFAQTVQKVARDR